MIDTPKTMTGAEFQLALDALGWRQTEFAVRAGVNPDSVNRWCKSRQPVPTWAQRHIELLLAGKEFYDAHIAPPPRTRRKAAADDQPADGVGA